MADGPALRALLERSRSLGFLGPGDVDVHVRHALGFATAVRAAPVRAVDLGSGGGVPGLVLAAAVWPDTAWTLLDAGERRCRFLEEAVVRLGLTARVDVLHARAEAAGRMPAQRGQADLIVARSFGPPAVTAECAAGLLRVGGELVVSEPPSGSGDRWPADGLATLGMERLPPTTSPTFHFVTIAQRRPCPDAYPRPIGRPAKRPLFSDGRSPG